MKGWVFKQLCQYAIKVGKCIMGYFLYLTVESEMERVLILKFIVLKNVLLSSFGNYIRFFFYKLFIKQYMQNWICYLDSKNGLNSPSVRMSVWMCVHGALWCDPGQGSGPGSWIRIDSGSILTLISIYTLFEQYANSRYTAHTFCNSSLIF